jgi:hypothetical protein
MQQAAQQAVQQVAQRRQRCPPGLSLGWGQHLRSAPSWVPTVRLSCLLT